MTNTQNRTGLKSGIAALVLAALVVAAGYAFLR